MESDSFAGAATLPLPEFSAGFPLPFRVLFLIGLALLLWAVNLHVLYLLGLDVSWALDIRDGDDTLDTDLNSLQLNPLGRDRRENTPSGRGPVSHLPSSHLYGPVYKLFVVYSVWCIAGWGIFRVVTGDDTTAMERMRGFVGIVCLVPLVVAATPWKGIAYRERRALRRAFARCLNPPAKEPIFFCDVILADILTSFAKVLGDLYVSAAQILFGGISQGRVAPHGASKFVVLAMVALPYVIRFRQCMLEFYHSKWTSMRPFANALKYASAFPVIFLSAVQKTVVHEVAAAKGMTVGELAQTGDRWFGEHRLFRLWLLAVAVNSMFSFYWDVEKDWGLSLLEVETWLPSAPREGNGSSHVTRGPRSLMARIMHRREHSRSPLPGPNFEATSPNRSAYFGLRPTLLLPDPAVYYLFTTLDLVLRFTWSLELSSHLHVISDIESGVFLMEALELVRRWMWVFIRVEWEAVRMGEMSRFRAAPSEQRTAVLWDGGKEED